MFIIGALRVNEFPPQARKKMINSIWFISCRIYLFIPLEQTVRRGLSTGWPSRDTRGFGIFNRPVCMESQWHRHQSFRPLHNSAKTCTRTILLESLGRINCGAAAVSFMFRESDMYFVAFTPYDLCPSTLWFTFSDSPIPSYMNQMNLPYDCSYKDM